MVWQTDKTQQWNNKGLGLSWGTLAELVVKLCAVLLTNVPESCVFIAVHLLL